ncbi:hypothetical protein GD466_02955 [Salmonella enterica]|nr:hypothetical protein [Salmonella enterica subsp. enterica serovar Muenchen]EDI7538455.1 hypothetical protein [Salmonella enterica]
MQHQFFNISHRFAVNIHSPGWDCTRGHFTTHYFITGAGGIAGIGVIGGVFICMLLADADIIAVGGFWLRRHDG